MEKRKVLFALQHTPKIGWKTIFRLHQHVELEKLPDMEPQEIQEATKIAYQRAVLVHDALREERVDALMRQYDQASVSWVAFGDDHYPELLQQTHWAPWVLYYRGNLSLLQNPCIAVVGTRVPTVYGRRTAKAISKQLSANGFTVISGLARGIDSCAHLGGLAERGKTVAVMGTSFTSIYPPENKDLCRNIEQEGLVMTEVPLGTKNHPGLFPLRNRIIASLSLGTLVVEGALNSGSLITAYLGLDYLSKDIFAIPGPIYSPMSEGPHDLIRKGASLVTCADDIINEYRHLKPKEKRYTTPKQSQEKLSDSEQMIIQLLQEKPLHIEELLRKTKFTFGHLHSVLLSLSMKQKIEHLPGSIYHLRLES